MLTSSDLGYDEHDDAHHHAYDANDDAESPLKGARTTVGGDAHHSSPQQIDLIQSDVVSLKKQFDDHQQYVKSELMSINTTLKCILTFTLVDKNLLNQGKGSSNDEQNKEDDTEEAKEEPMV
ncbi:hypothetical protein FNV43_RR11064 [Rhamnella rubrinervis]|uniref:Uncharacterized protein n=1 Tax=Rhamnella rubrinervis TaxID=2594499 RepID=A0A8K0H502_9ROSA|nr:hypothetical protein FNV43_RR11064 [Rhamnella rubrinervis]